VTLLLAQDRIRVRLTMTDDFLIGIGNNRSVLLRFWQQTIIKIAF